MDNKVVEKVWLTDTEVWIRTTDGREACEKFSDYQRKGNPILCMICL